MKKNLLKNRWTEQAKAEEAERKRIKSEIARKQAPPDSKRREKTVPQKRKIKRNNQKQPNQWHPLPYERQDGGRRSHEGYLPNEMSVDHEPERRERHRKWTGVQQITSKPDYMLLNISLLLICIGLVMVFSSSSYEGLMTEESGIYFFVRQVIFALIGLVAMVLMMFISPVFVNRYSWLGLFIIAGLIIYATRYGPETYGAQRWIALGPFQFMPSDFAKPLSIVCFATVLNQNKDDFDSSRVYLKTLIIMSILPVIIVVEDLGTAIVFFAGLFAMLIVAGAKPRNIFFTILGGTLAFVVAVLLEPYRLRRITAFLHADEAAVADAGGYQLKQSLYAFGEGGLFGVGLGNGGQKMSHLFASHTDFIYSVIGEELGLIGAFGVLALFVAFVWRGYWIAMHIRDDHKSLVVFGSTTFIGLQALINMGVAVGVMPVTGITLPFISYGGTSLLVTLSMLGYMLNLSRYMEPLKKRKL